jgi:RNA polymerase sigma-70 factor (ECF subfamily)
MTQTHTVPRRKSGRLMTVADQPADFDDQRRSALMEKAQSGDRGAYDALLRECVGLIGRFARYRGVPIDQVDDVVQDVLLTVHRARQTYDPARSFTAWLRVITERRAIDVLRRTGRRAAREVHAPLALETYADTATDPSHSLDASDRAAAVGHALAALPERQREAVQHLVVEGRSLADAAQTTRRSKTALKVSLHRALKSLRGQADREA